MRNGILQIQPKKPTIGCIHFYFLHRLAHAPNTEHILQDWQLDQRHRIQARPASLVAVFFLHQIVDEAPIDGSLQFPHQMILRNKVIQAQ